MNKHTPEPWWHDDNAPMIYGEVEDGLVRIADATAATGDEDLLTFEMEEANTKRIVQCINGCAGILDPEEAVPELVRLLGAVLGCCELNLDDIEDETRKVVQEAGCFLADITGGAK